MSIIDLPLELIDLICNNIWLERLEDIPLQFLNQKRIEKYWEKIGIYELIEIDNLQGFKHVYNNIQYRNIWTISNDGGARHEHPIIRACIKGNFDMVKYMIENGTDIRIFSDLPLICAIEHNHMRILKYLVKKGVSISNNRGNIFYWHINSLEMLKYIMVFEPDMIYIQTGPLLRASEKGDFEMVKYIVNLFIVKNGIENLKNIPQINKCKRNADTRGHTEIVQYFTDFGITLEK